jgi:hypothetical protein
MDTWTPLVVQLFIDDRLNKNIVALQHSSCLAVWRLCLLGRGGLLGRREFEAILSVHTTHSMHALVHDLLLLF